MNEILPKTDPSSPFNSKISTASQPTEVLSKRFELWRQIIKSLLFYFKTLAISEQQQVELNRTIVNSSLNFPFFTDIAKAKTQLSNQYELIEPHDSNKQSFFSPFGSGSIQDVQILLKKYHVNLINQKVKTARELQLIVVRLEELQKDLLSKIKEIRGLNGDFKNNLNQEIATTGQLLDSYISVVSKLTNGEEIEVSDPKHDPFLKKFRLEAHLKQQIHQENYLEEAFINLQITALELEKIVFKEIQESLNKFSELISQEIFVHYNDLINELHQGIISKQPFFEWDEFIQRDNGKNLILLKHDDNVPKLKKLSDIKYPFDNSLFGKTIRSGYLMKKSKLLKTYSKSFFLLTLTYLHEFKSSNLSENSTPISSLRLNDCILTDASESKFQLHVNSQTLIKTHNIVFKKPDDVSNTDFKKWTQDLKNLTSFDSLSERFEYVSNKLTSSSQMNSRSHTPGSLASNQTNQLLSGDEIRSKLEKLTVSSKPSLSLQTNPSTLHIPPTLQIQEPTPVRYDAPQLPSTSSFEPINQPTLGNQSQHVTEPHHAHHDHEGQDHHPVQISVPIPISGGKIPSRVSTPMIGEVGANILGSSIDLGERLYEEGGIDLTKFLQGDGSVPGTSGTATIGSGGPGTGTRSVHYE